MRRFFCLLATLMFAWALPAAAQTMPPVCPANQPPGRAFHGPPAWLTVLADSAFLYLRGAPRFVDTLSARIRLQVQPSGSVELLCVHTPPHPGAIVLVGAARLLRFQRELDRPFRDTATVDVTLAVTRPLRGEPVHRVERRVVVGEDVRVELAELPIERSTGSFTRDEQVAIYRAALESIRAVERVGTGVRCVVFTHGEGLDYAVAALLNRPERTVVHGRACPPTHFEGRVGADYSAVPPGWVDPFRYEIGPMDAWSADTAAFNVVTVQSARESGHACVVVRDGAGWRAQCRSEWSRVTARDLRGTGRARLAARRDDRVSETRSG